MISIAGVPLLVSQAATEDAVDVSALLFAPQAAIPGGVGVPPARTPYRVPYAPGCLFWPSGASRFAVGQYLVTDEEVEAIWGETFTTAALTLTLGSLSFTVRPLILLPLGLDRSPVNQRVGAGGLYLLILVDGRYFLQTTAPTWTITQGSTTWDNLDTQLDTFFGGALTYDAADADYLYPSSDLAAPTLASQGVPCWAGPLLDAIAVASGRRFVAFADGTYGLQSWSTAATADAASRTSNADYLATGGLLAFPPADEATDGLYVVPTSIACVYPERNATPAETTPFVVTTTFSSARTNAGYATTDVAALEGTLRVGMNLWADGANDAALTAHGTQWATDWYAWLRGEPLLAYAGLVDYTPSGYTDQIVWQANADAVATRVYRDRLNPRPPSTVAGYSGVTPLGPVFPSGAVFTGPMIFYGSTTTFDGDTTVVNEATNVYTGSQYYPVYDYSGTLLTGVVVDLVLPATNCRLLIASAAEYVELAGIDPGADPDGRLVYLYNVGNYTILIPNESASEGTAARRILTTDDNYYFLSPRECVGLWYDGSIDRWRVSENSHKRLCKVRTYAEWSTDQENTELTPATELHLISASTEINWSGIANGKAGLRHRVMNTGSAVIYLLHNSANSASGNRLLLPNFTPDMPLYPDQYVQFEYDATALEVGAWRVMGLFPEPPAGVTVAAVTSVCPTTFAGTVAATEATQLSSSTWTLLTGTDLTLTVTKGAVYTFIAVFDINGDGDADVVFDCSGTDEAIDTYEGALSINGTRLDAVATFAPAHPMSRATVTQVWTETLTAGDYALQLEGRRASGTGTAWAEAVNTTLTILAQPSLSVQRQTLGIPGGTVGAAECEDDPADCCGGSGSGSGSGGGGTGIQTSCCVNEIPTTLYWIVEAGPCAGTYTLTWSTVSLSWTGTGPELLPISLVCYAGNWIVGGSDPGSVVVTSCDPLLIDFTFSWGTCGANRAAYIVEAPP